MIRSSILFRRKFSQLLAVTAGTAVLILTGCGVGIAAKNSDATVVAFQGEVHGGQSPIQGATVMLYHTDSSATTYGAPAVYIGTATSDVNGNFQISPSATSGNCPSGTQAYITAAGGYQSGQPGLVNGQMLLIAALGDCSSISASTTVIINEVTTVAAAYALSGFTTTTISGGLPVANISAPVANSTAASSATANTPAGLVHAFMNANNLVNYAVGMPNGSVTAYSNGSTVTGVVPYVEILTLADAMAACVNSQSSTSSQSTGCSTLFGYTPSISGATPTNTFQAFINLARNPYPSSAVLAGVLNLTNSTSPFQPKLTAAPLDWSLSIVYGKGVLPAPLSVALDANDTIYFGNKVPTASTPALYGVSAYGITVPTFAPESTISASAGVKGLAVDTLGNIWAANNGYATDRFSLSNGTLQGTFTSTVNGSVPIAVDRANNLWVGHVSSGAGINIEGVVYNSGSWSLAYTASPGSNTGPYGISVDATQNIWAAGYYNGGKYEVVIPNTGTSSSPAYTGTTTSGVTAINPVIKSIVNTVDTTVEPYSTVFDSSGNGWVAITGSNSLSTTGIVPTTLNASTSATSLSVGTTIYGTTAGTNGNILGTLSTLEMAIDSAGVLFIADNLGSTQGLHMYSSTTSNTLTPSTGLKSCYLATSTTTVCGATGNAAIAGPYHPAIDSTGSVWTAINSGGVTQTIGLASPSYPVLAIGKWSIAPGLGTAASLP